MENIYAQALWRLVESGADVKHAVRSLAEMLERRGRGALMPRITRAFRRLSMEEMRKERSALIVARKSDEKFARKESGASDAEIHVDETLIGGWRFEDKEKLTDASWKKHLLSIYGKVTNQ